MTTGADSPTPNRPRPLPERNKGRLFRFRRRYWIPIAFCLLLVVAYFTYTPIISALVSHELQNAIDTRLHAELQYASLTYVFPYEVRLKNVRMRTDPALGNHDLITAERLDLRLAHLPRWHRPVVIESVTLQSPSINILREPTGMVGVHGLRKTDQEQQQRPPAHKLSEMFELRKLTIVDGRVQYLDRAVPGAEPLMFRGITTTIGVTPQSNAVYAYQLHADEQPFVEMNVEGTVDVDSADVEVKKLAMSAEAKRVDGQTSIPPKLQRLVNELGIAGKINLTGHGSLPIRDPAGRTFSAEMALVDGRGILPGNRGNLDQLSVKAFIEYRDHKTLLTVPQIIGSSGPTRLVARVSGVFPTGGDDAAKAWTAHGEAQLTNAKLLTSASISDIASRLGIPQESLTTGDAAAIFSIHDHVVTIQHGAVNTPVLGLQGTGTVNFDGEANLSVIAAPLGDWRKKAEQSGVPILSDVAGAVAGAAQKLVSAGSKYLYAFEVKGKLSQPQIRAVPAPALTDNAAGVFGKMMQEVKSVDLLKSIKEGE